MKNPYSSTAWRRFRAAYLAEHPRCVVCGKPATVVDHVIDAVAAGLFPNLPPGTPAFQAMDASCHSKKTARRFA